MRISVNLATRPFVELRPLFARLRLVMIVLALVAVGLGVWLHALNGKAKLATAQMSALRAETSNYEQERRTNEARMREPQNQSVLARSQFLNTLFAKKSFSWTAVMMDLEHVLPGGVQVTAIEPSVSKEGTVSIRLRVTGDRDKAIQLVRNLESSQRFVKPRLGGETALTAEKANAFGRTGATPASASLQNAALSTGVEFEIFSDYAPLSASTGKREEGVGSSKPAAKAPRVVKPKAASLPPARPMASTTGGKR
jgi:type IV pilus assembly protein PilN